MPNLVTVNESGVARSNTVDDWVCYYVDPNEDTYDCSFGVQRAAGGSKDSNPVPPRSGTKPSSRKYPASAGLTTMTRLPATWL